MVQHLKIFLKGTSLLLAVFLLPVLLWARPESGVVRRVLSADTLQLMDGTKVRYIGVIVADKSTDYYVEATSLSRTLLENKDVILEYGLQEMGLDGVWLVYVFADGIFINKQLVQDGLAVVSPVSADDGYLKILLKAEKEAQRSKKGLWKDTAVAPYSQRSSKSNKFPWATSEQIKKGLK